MTREGDEAMADSDASPDLHAEASASMEGSGRRVVDGFDLVEKIATGGATVIWEALERGTNQTHAIKLLQPSLLKDKDQLATLKHESKVGAAFSHPCVIRMANFVKTKAHAYVVMELFKYPNLKALLKNDPVVTKAATQKIVEGVCQGLSHIHEKGWLHLDIKPDNLLIAPTGEVRVIDFSLSEKPSGGLAGLFGNKVIRGTRTYIAPETILKKAKTPATDVYSLGVTLFELLAGRPPFAGNDPNHMLRQHLKEAVPPASEFNDNLTPEADKLLQRMLAKKPADRQQTPTEVFAEFRTVSLFHRDPKELLEEKRKREAEAELDAASILDSRADAVRTAKGIKPPPKPKVKERRRADIGGLAKKAAAREAEKKAASQPQPGPPQGYPPNFPAPGYFPQPQYSPPPQFVQPAYAAGQAPPGQPFPVGQQPPPSYPPQQAPAPGGGPARPSGPPQSAGQPAGPQVQVPGLTRTAETQHASQKATSDDDLPLMTELPDII
ncbi:MAG: serine/threonine-protein kinase [Planctomycetota bacterium]